jgi:hypothetical protein
MRLVPYKREPREHVPSTMWEHKEKMTMDELGSGPSPDTEFAGAFLLSSLQNSEK